MWVKILLWGRESQSFSTMLCFSGWWTKEELNKRGIFHRIKENETENQRISLKNIRQQSFKSTSSIVLPVNIIGDFQEVVAHGLEGQLVQQGADGIETSVQQDQLSPFLVRSDRPHARIIGLAGVQFLLHHLRELGTPFGEAAGTTAAAAHPRVISDRRILAECWTQSGQLSSESFEMHPSRGQRSRPRMKEHGCRFRWIERENARLERYKGDADLLQGFQVFGSRRLAQLVEELIRTGCSETIWLFCGGFLNTTTNNRMKIKTILLLSCSQDWFPIHISWTNSLEHSWSYFHHFDVWMVNKQEAEFSIFWSFSVREAANSHTVHDVTYHKAR